jgi:SSS family solute:Na+ symporter
MPLALLLLLATACASALSAGESPNKLSAFPGTTPTLDGVLAPGEWADATQFYGVKNWAHTFTPTRDPKDLALHGFVKHDGKRLYFAFDVTDDVLYGIDTPRWLPKENPNAHALTREGYPWFGDEVELLINATNKWVKNEDAAGDGASWQMVCNLTKSRLGGVGNGGLLEGEPRKSAKAWSTYNAWILERHQEAAVKVKPGGKGYIIEWAVDLNPCVEVAPGRFWSPELGNRAVGLNIALGDLDEQEKGAGNFANFHHEEWFAGHKTTRTQLREWGTLILMSAEKGEQTPREKPPARRSKPTKSLRK